MGRGVGRRVLRGFSVWLASSYALSGLAPGTVHAEAVPPDPAAPTEAAASLAPPRTDTSDSGPAVALATTRSSAPASAGVYWALAEAATTAQAEGRLADAVDALRRAHGLWPSARSLRGLGLLAIERRRVADAVRYLEAALDTELRPLEGDLRASTLEVLLRVQREVGRIDLGVEPAGAAVELDGRRFVLSQLVVTPGPHTLRVSAPGWLPREERITVAAGQSVALRVALASPLPLTAPSEAPPWRRRAWLIGGAAVVLVAGAAALGLVLARPPPPYATGNTGELVGAR